MDALRSWGANTEEGLARCMNNEPFYLQMVELVLADRSFDVLKSAMEAGDWQGAFQAAHSLKGSVGNVSLTPIYQPLCTLTDQLRGPHAPRGDGETLLAQIVTQREKALSL